MLLNVFHLAADWLHAFAVLVLIYQIIKTRSCHTVSGKSTILYAVVFSCRYLDLYPFPDYRSSFLLVYVTVYKIYFLLSAYLIICFVYIIFNKTRDKATDTYPCHYLLICAVLLTLGTYDFNSALIVDNELFWRFSIILEIFAIVPQLRLLKEQSTMDKMMQCYVMMIGSYRAMYICHWLYRYQTERYWQPIMLISGCVQTMIYLYFFLCIYPRLNKKRQCKLINGKRDIGNVYNIIVDMNEKQKHGLPLIHNVA